MLGGNPNAAYGSANAFKKGPFGQQQGTQNPYGIGYQQTAGRLASQPMVQQNSNPYGNIPMPEPKAGSRVYPHPPNPTPDNRVNVTGLQAQGMADDLMRQLELYYASLRPGPGRAVHMIGY